MDDVDWKMREFSSLLRTVELLHKVDQVEKVHRLLLSLLVSSPVVGFSRALLFEIDSERRSIRGCLGVQSTVSVRERGVGADIGALSERIMENYRNAESTDLTLQAKTFSVSLDWFRSALVKAVRTGYPVLAERVLSEFATDPVLRFFETEAYLALPLEESSTGSSAEAEHLHRWVIAVDGWGEGRPGDARISFAAGLAHQASIAAAALRSQAMAKQRSRVLGRIVTSLRDARSDEELSNILRTAVMLLSKTLGASAGMLEDFSRGKSFYLKRAPDGRGGLGRAPEAVPDGLERIVKRAAGMGSPIHGSADHPLLSDASRVAWFASFPLVAMKEVIGCILLYGEKNGFEPKSLPSPADLSLLEAASGVMAQALFARRASVRLKRNEAMLEELRSNLQRERQLAHLGEKGIEFCHTIADEAARMRRLLSRVGGEGDVVEKLEEGLRELETFASDYAFAAKDARLELRFLNPFKLVKKLTAEWNEELSGRGVEVIRKIPAYGPRLFMDAKNISLALRNIFESVASVLGRGDKLMVECTSDEEKVSIAIADTGAGLPGDVISRLFMPFRDIQVEDERKNALSLAAEIVSLHGGEIIVRSSVSWTNILVLNFGISANRDRRKRLVDRRRHRDRRVPVKKG